MSLERSYIALAKPPLPPFLECRKDIPPRELINCVRAEVEEKSNLTRVQQDVVFIGHHGQYAIFTLDNGILSNHLRQLNLMTFWQILAASATPIVP